MKIMNEIKYKCDFARRCEVARQEYVEAAATCEVEFRADLAAEVYHKHDVGPWSRQMDYYPRCNDLECEVCYDLDKLK